MRPGPRAPHPHAGSERRDWRPSGHRGLSSFRCADARTVDSDRPPGDLSPTRPDFDPARPGRTTAGLSEGGTSTRPDPYGPRVTGPRGRGMSDDVASFLAAHRTDGRRAPPPRLVRFQPSERTMTLPAFDPSLGAWPLGPTHRKFMTDLRAHAAEQAPREALVILHDFAVGVKKGEAFHCGRRMIPVRLDPASDVLRATGTSRVNRHAPAASGAGIHRAPPPLPPGAAFVILVPPDVDPFASSLDPVLHPCILASRPLRILAGAGATAGPAAEAWVSAGVGPVPLDASQVAAFDDIVSGRDTAVVGPPGCGKSQLIAALLAAAPAGLRICCTSTEESALRMLRRRAAAHPSAAEVLIATPDEVAARATPDHVYDLMIIDEAARMPLGVGLVLAARARQLALLGDPSQLGPDRGGESLLDRAMSRGVASRTLRTHYRSSTASLIEPSNLLVYGQVLQAVPSPAIAGVSGLRLFEHRRPSVSCVDGRWVVTTEGDAVIRELEEHARSGDRRSLAVISLRPDQTAYLARRVSEAIAEGRFSRGDLDRVPDEPFFVANATAVQGEERDRILISCGFARRGSNTIKRLGSLEGDRPLALLNVASTRARDACDVHVSAAADDIERSDLTPARAAFLFWLKSLRLFTRVSSELEIDKGLAHFARQRGLVARHLGLVQGLYRPGDAAFRVGIVKHETPHDAARWGEIASQLRAKAWETVEATADRLEALRGSGPSSLRDELDGILARSGI